jgi:signal transduction histidine kinase
MMAFGLLLAGVLTVEVAVITRSPIPDLLVVAATILTSLPGIAVLVLGGYWLGRSDIDPSRYTRIAAWTTAGFGFFISLFVLVAIFTINDVRGQVGVLRWAASVGAGSGALVGLFEARAIERAVAAEETRVRNQELSRQNERLEEFASIIAHDLRNPLNVATGRIQSVRQQCEDEQLDSAATALDRMGQIVEETLKLARSGQVVDETEPVHLRELAEDCWETVDTDSATLSVEDSGVFSADRDRCRHLVENLFRNAVEHGSTSSRSSSTRGNAVEHGGSDVTIRVGTLADGFYVEDDGPGIPEADRERVLDAGFSTTEGGTGFGLAIVTQIAEAHGWHVSVAESADGGARFEIAGIDVSQASSGSGGRTMVAV